MSSLDSAAEGGHLKLVTFLSDNRTEGCTSNAMDLAAKNGHLEVVEWINEYRDEGCTVGAMDLAAEYGHLNILEYLHLNRTEGCTQLAMHMACANGHLDVVKFLHLNRTEGCSLDAINNACANGHLEIVQYLWENRTEPAGFMAFLHAAINGHLHVLNYISVHIAIGNPEFTQANYFYALERAATKGHFYIVKYINSFINSRLRSNALNLACKVGDLDLVSFLHSQNYDGTTFEAMDNAATYGHLDIVQFLHSNRSEGASKQALNGSAYHGHLNVVKFLSQCRSEGGSNRAIDFAASNGHLDVVKYLDMNRNEGYTSFALESSCLNGHLEIVEYLSKKQSAVCSKLTLIKACEGGHIDIVKFICETFDKQHHYQKALIAAAKKDLVITQYVLEYARNNGDNSSHEIISTDVMISAITSGHLDTFDYLYRSTINKQSISYSTLVGVASQHGKTDILNYLVRVIPVDSNTSNIDSCANSLIYYGHLDILQVFMSKHRLSLGSLVVPDKTFQRLCKNGDIGMIKYIAQPKHFTETHRLTALQHERLSVYIFLNSHNPQYGEKEMELAIKNGYMVVVRHILESSPKPFTNLLAFIELAKETIHHHITNYLVNQKERLDKRRRYWTLFK
ncbi:hypothetical protein SAMD00019534_101830 [Acytostelium subglobosum LB1]|uniref:hypothetical protein n=1 Tax=Acytostelium subglobosum LB1 TaxID=1410327 RepID=UPI000644D2FB|nr:hypothetical protein SAMD00019534_101830 [Acytostelium subglobosum LB1]GAM27008.1 hypothetical protein SAMD00019534_101830 [Acytostelium subglobosum LB1]|eukprot:XP_012749888.1 hypothetical protein SAMD00019534_101830 [Acytostelium subglobosum LB1]